MEGSDWLAYTPHCLRGLGSGEEEESDEAAADYGLRMWAPVCSFRFLFLLSLTLTLPPPPLSLSLHDRVL